MQASEFHAQIERNAVQARHIIDKQCKRYGTSIEEMKVKLAKQFNGNLTISRERHIDEMGRPQHSLIQTQQRSWSRSVERHIDQHIAELLKLEARRKAYDPEGKGRYEPSWAFDIHPITMALLKYYEDAGNLPVFDRSQANNGELGRGVVFHQSDAPDSPIEMMDIGYSSGVIRLGTAYFKNGMIFSYENDRKVPFLVIPETFPQSIMASFKGKNAGDIIDIFAGAPGMGRIKVTRAQEHVRGTRLDFTNRLVPWESSQYDKAPWRRTNLSQ